MVSFPQSFSKSDPNDVHLCEGEDVRQSSNPVAVQVQQYWSNAGLHGPTLSKGTLVGFLRFCLALCGRSMCGVTLVFLLI